jgi:hypothetical protein
MCPHLGNPGKLLFLIRISSLAALTFLLSGWTTCSGAFFFNSCPGSVPQPQITSLSLGTIPDDAETVLLTVKGRGFVPQSQIMWNGNALQTTFVDSSNLEAAITQQAFDSVGGAAGSTVQISVRSMATVVVVGCPNGGTSGTLDLAIH